MEGKIKDNNMPYRKINRPNTFIWNKDTLYTSIKPYDHSCTQFYILSDGDDCFCLYYKGNKYDSDLKFIPIDNVDCQDIDSIKKYVQKNYVELINKYE